MNQTLFKKKYLLYKETDPYRYFLLFRGHALVFTGYCIVSIETLIAIKLGLTPITYMQTLIASASVLSVTVIMFLVIKMKRKLLLWQEWAIFGIDIIFYLLFYAIWVYRLGELRILGLLSALIAIIIVISYTSFIQSLIMSIPTIIVYFSVTYCAIVYGHQQGELAREVFLSLCFIPTFILIAVAARGITNRRRQLQKAKKKLETTNIELNELNNSLQHEHSLAEIEMELAHDLQAALFPVAPPVVKDWEIAFVSNPRYGVSGDFYDFYTEGDTLEGMSLFDVSGHGVASALITILSKPVLFRNFKKLSSGKTASIVDETNRDLLEQLEDVNSYITGILLRMRDDSVEYVNAGHPDLLHLRKSTGNVRVVTDPECRFRGSPIGIFSRETKYCSVRFNVSSGDAILLYTDGLLESRDGNGTSFGREGIAGAFSETAGMNAGDALEHIMKKLREYTGGRPASDDLTVIVARRL
ncbi:MAG TPA: SpoIIE family protein phosphatase [Spirochaetota bacterium]|nr:SpoIIE family protein phosphatase [Spirochaetota bacterium]